MADLPPLIHETSSQSPSKASEDYSPSCPFCTIASAYGPLSPLSDPETALRHLNPENLDPPSFVLYSSEDVVAFLDIMPLTKGHVLIAPRKHRVKVGDLSPDEGAEVCFSWVPTVQFHVNPHPTSRGCGARDDLVLIMLAAVHRLAEYSPS
jgi:hypothetical protein